MRLYIERFVIPLLQAICFGVLIGTWKLPAEIRIPCAVLIGVSAGVTALFISKYQEKRENAEDEKPRKTGKAIWGFFAIATAAGVVAGLILLSRPLDSTHPGDSKVQNTSQNPGLKSGAGGDSKTAPEPQSKVDTPSQPARKGPDSEVHPAIPSQGYGQNGVLKYIKAPIRSGSGGNDWPVLIYGDDGSDYPVLRARAEQVLQNSGRSTPQIFADDIDPHAYKRLFNADVQTMYSLRDYCDGVVLGLVKSATSKSDQLESLYTTHLSVDLKLVPVSGRVPREISVDESGAGVSAEESRSRAEERLAEKLKVALSGLL